MWRIWFRNADIRLIKQCVRMYQKSSLCHRQKIFFLILGSGTAQNPTPLAPKLTRNSSGDEIVKCDFSVYLFVLKLLINK